MSVQKLTLCRLHIYTLIHSDSHSHSERGINKKRHIDDNEHYKKDVKCAQNSAIRTREERGNDVHQRKEMYTDK